MFQTTNQKGNLEYSSGFFKHQYDPKNPDHMEGNPIHGTPNHPSHSTILVVKPMVTWGSTILRNSLCWNYQVELPYHFVTPVPHIQWRYTAATSQNIAQNIWSTSKNNLIIFLEILPLIIMWTNRNIHKPLFAIGKNPLAGSNMPLGISSPPWEKM